MRYALRVVSCSRGDGAGVVLRAHVVTRDGEDYTPR